MRNSEVKKVVSEWSIGVSEHWSIGVTNINAWRERRSTLPMEEARQQCENTWRSWRCGRTDVISRQIRGVSERHQTANWRPGENAVRLKRPMHPCRRGGLPWRKTNHRDHKKHGEI